MIVLDDSKESLLESDESHLSMEVAQNRLISYESYRSIDFDFANFEIELEDHFVGVETAPLCPESGFDSEDIAT